MVARVVELVANQDLLAHLLLTQLDRLMGKCLFDGIVRAYNTENTFWRKHYILFLRKQNVFAKVFLKAQVLEHCCAKSADLRSFRAKSTGLAESDRSP